MYYGKLLPESGMIDMYAVCRFGGEVPSAHAEKGAAAIRELGQQVGPLVDAYVTALEARKLKDGIRIAMSMSSLGKTIVNQLINLNVTSQIRN